MIAIRDGSTLRIGADIADAMIGPPKSHGVVVVGGTRLDWISTIPAGASETAIRRAARMENMHISLFVSQGN